MGRSTLRKKICMSVIGLSSFTVLASNFVQFPEPESEPAQYQIADLGVGMYPSRVNNSGTVVGILTGRLQGTEAFVWREETGRNDLKLDSESLSFANDISDSGLVVGHVGDQKGASRAYSWMSQNLDFDFSPFEEGQSIAYGVNTDGYMVGQVGENALSNFEAFRYEPGQGVRHLGTLGGNLSQASALNDRGEVVGWSVTADRRTHAFKWVEEQGMIDLGTLGGERSLAAAINEEGLIVGQAQTREGSTHAALFRDTKITDLGSMGGRWSLASDINNHGLIVGQADGEPDRMPEFAKRALNLGARLFSSQLVKTSSRAVLWKEGSPQDLNRLIPQGSEWTALSAATGVNDRGQIVGFGNKNGHLHGFLLTPVELEEESNVAVTVALESSFLSVN
ncbi:MAG: DUF3466 family protein [Candidatus Omnitrophica bacterium]|nr:DUF3466 family protein [Candidatus Omnitrophota bacterium]